MPGFDGTGPRGQGAMTGGGRGYCLMPASEVSRLFGRGFNSRKRGGRGWRNCYYATDLPGWMRAQRGMSAFGGLGHNSLGKDELSVLKIQAESLKSELDIVQARVQELEQMKKEDLR